MNDQEISAKVAKILLSSQAVKLNPTNPFTWTSGLRSPIYCDNRVLLSYPEYRDQIKDAFVSLQNRFGKIDSVSGVATAGIAHGALLADALKLPFSYVRPEPKKHGMQNQIEGRLLKGTRVLVVEDLISTGKSSIAACKALIDAEVQVAGVVSVFTYGLPIAIAQFSEANIPFISLTNFEMLIKVAAEENLIDKAQLPIIGAWSSNPQKWSDEFLGL